MVAYEKQKYVESNGAMNKSYSEKQPKNENENNCHAFFANKRKKIEEKGAVPTPDEESKVEAHTQPYNQNPCFL